MMNGLSSELLLLLLFGAFMVFNIVMQRAARARQAQEAPPEPLTQEELDPELEPEPPAFVLPAKLAARASTARAAPVATARRRFSRQALFGNRRAAQDAFVVATILGRCRADQPHEPL